MKKSSSIDNPFFRLMGAIGDLVVLNILWLLCCLPVVTAGASTLALFAIVHKIAAGEDYRTAAGFFNAFRRDFKQATALWLVVLAAGIAAPDGSEAAVFAVGDALSGSHGTASMNSLPRLPLQGLDPAAVYEDEQGVQYTGAQLMALGLPLPGPRGQTPACIWYLHRV